MCVCDLTLSHARRYQAGYHQQRGTNIPDMNTLSLCIYDKQKNKPTKLNHTITTCAHACFRTCVFMSVCVFVWYVCLTLRVLCVCISLKYQTLAAYDHVYPPTQRFRKTHTPKWLEEYSNRRTMLLQLRGSYAHKVFRRTLTRDKQHTNVMISCYWSWTNTRISIIPKWCNSECTSIDMTDS